MSQHPPESEDPVRLTFTRVRWREGYNADEVDAFLRRVRRSLGSGDGSVTAHDVSAIRFSPVRIKEGYHMGEVDAELERLAVRLRNHDM